MAERQVPAYLAESYRSGHRDHCVAVFVIDENGRLHRQLDRMQRHADELDIVVADGGSRDGSVDRDQLEPRGVHTRLVKTGPGRLGAQMRMAFAWALDRGYRGVICMDGNGKDGVEALPRFARELESGTDHVQGSRYLPGGEEENTPISRRLAVRWIHAPLIRLASGFPYTDTTNGFRAYSARFLSDPAVDAFRDVFVGYELHYYLAIRAARLGFRTVEIPVSRRYPARGPVPTKISPIRGNLAALRCLLAACAGRYDPKGSEGA